MREFTRRGDVREQAHRAAISAAAMRAAQGLRIADASVMPRVTTGNTMAGCIIIGEQAAGAIDA